MRLYRYVGPERIREQSKGSPGGAPISGPESIRSWATRTGQRPDRTGLIRGTYVVDSEGQMLVADYGSEHVACAIGNPVLAAGVAWFAIRPSSVEVTTIDNYSTGYCPEPACWPAVEAALDRAGISHPSAFTTELVFRLCRVCGQRNVVRDDWYVCAVCNSELSRDWNFSPESPT